MRHRIFRLIAVTILVLCLAACKAQPEPTVQCEHDYRKMSIKEGTCAVNGSIDWQCILCGEKMVETIPGKHIYNCTNTRPATCASEGLTTYTCAACNASYSEPIPKTEHQFDDGVISRAPTCAAEGIRTRSCIICNAAVEELIAKSSHQYDNGKVTTPATCTQTGIRTYTCSGCHASSTETISKTAHQFDNGKVTAEATCTTDGSKTVTCSACGETRTERIAATGHNYSGSSCTSASSCSKCGATQSAALGHDWAEATCTSAKKCRRCGMTDGNALGHNYVGQTCTEKGTCTNCGDTIAASGHKYASGKCSVCGNSDPNKIYSLGETWVVDGQWEFTVTSVTVHNLCNSIWNKQKGLTDEMVVVIEYTYKNIGYNNDVMGLYMNSVCFDVYDQEGEAGDTYACTHEKSAKECIVGTKCTASEAFSLTNDSNSVKLVVREKPCTIENGKNKYGKDQTAVFVLDVTNNSSSGGNTGGTTSGGNTGSNKPAWSSSDLDTLKNHILQADAFAQTTASMAQSALSGTNETTQLGNTSSAIRFAKEVKAKLSSALQMFQTRADISYSGSSFSSVKAAVQAAYNAISPAAAYSSYNASNWRSISSNILSACQATQAITGDLVSNFIYPSN